MKRAVIPALCVLAICVNLAFAVRLLAADDGNEKTDFDKRREQAMERESANERARADEIRKDLHEESKEVEKRLEDVRKWSVQQFELGESRGMYGPGGMTPLMAKWQRQRQTEINQLVMFPEKSGGGIESGRALNTLMERVGPAALQNVETRKIRPEAAMPLTEPPELIRVDRALAEEVTWQDNTHGPRRIGQGSRGPLDLDWPSILKEHRWDSFRQRFNDARDKAVAEQGRSEGISADTQAELRDAISALNTEFADYRLQWIHSEHPDVDRGLEFRRICDGKDHIKKLVLGAYQLAELAPNQTTNIEAFRGGTIEDYVAYLQKNNLRFASASPAHRSAYYKLFSQMIRYYLDVRMSVRLRQQREAELSSELANVKQNEQNATDIAMGRTMTASDAAAVEIQALKTFATALEQK